MPEIKKDLIIVGGGLTGLSCGITAVSKGLDVTVLERQESIGSDGSIDELAYTHSLKKVFSDYANYPDVFTPLTRRAFWIATPDAHTAWECVTLRGTGASGFVVNRPEFDKELARRFKSLGGNLRMQVEIENLIDDPETGAITGVKLNTGEEIFSNLVILAQCYQSNLVDDLVHFKKPSRDQQVLVAKEILAGDNPMPSVRFTSDENHAASVILLGDPLGIGFSWGRLIAFKDKLIVKIYVPFDLVGEKQDYRTFIERFKMHPSVESMVKGYKSISFKAGVIQSSGFSQFVENLWGKGYLVTGKTARLYHPFDCRMTDYAVESGTIAANAAINAKLDRRPSYPSDYPNMLKDSYILPDRNSMMNFMSLMREKKNFNSAYPEILMSIVDGVFTMDGRRKSVKKKDIERELRSKSALWGMFQDFYTLFKSYG